MKIVEALRERERERERESGNLKNKKSAKGITLIALIITIIVLLILAGVTLNAVIGNDGIIAKAQLARQKTNQSQGEEENKIKDLENELANYSTRTNDTKSTTRDETLLWNSPITSGTITFLDNHNINEFDEIVMIYTTTAEEQYLYEFRISSMTYKMAMTDEKTIEMMSDATVYFDLDVTANTMAIVRNKIGSNTNNLFEIKKVYGIKY